MLKMEQWRAVDTHSGGVEAQNVAEAGGSVNQWSQIRITLTRNRIRIQIRVKMKIRIRGFCIKVKRGIRIRICINVKRIRNTVRNQIQIQEKERLKGSVVDPDPGWIRIEWGPWIRIQIQEGKKKTTKIKSNKFPFLKC
jgi:hypothetical protein